MPLPTPRILQRLVLIVLVMLSALFVGASPASADETESAAPAQSEEMTDIEAWEFLWNDLYGGYVPCGGNSFSNANPNSADLLPVNRWIGATSGYHTRLGAKFTDDIAQRLSRDVVAPVGLTVGNSMWQMSTGLMDFANNFAILDTLGCQADLTAAKIGNALTGPVVAAVAVAFLTFLWKRWRGGAGGGQGGWKSLTKPVMVFCLFAIMLNGANATANSMSASGSGGIVGTGSPKWFVDHIDAFSDRLINPIVDAIGDSDLSTPVGEGNSCVQYVDGLHSLYRAANDAGASRGSSIPLVMSRMWEQSGLRVWAAGQFGVKNDFGDYVYCHLLEREVRTPFEQQWSIMRTAYGMPDSMRPAPKVLVGGSNTEVDQRTIMLAQCQWTGSNWTVRGQWSSVARGGEDGDAATGEDCEQGWSSDESHPGVFDYEDKPNFIAESTAGASEVADFLYNFHGDSSSTAISTAILYAIASLLMLLVMGGLALSVILAKLAVVVLILFTFVMLVASMIPGNEGKEAKYFKFLCGAIVYSYLLTLILSIVVIITQWIVDAGATQFGAGSFMAILVMTFAPIAAVVIVNMVAKNFLGAPSLLKPTGSLAFAAAMGGAGAGIGIGADRMMRRARSQADRRFGRARQASKNRLKSALSGTGKDGKAKDRKHGFEENAQEGRGKDALGTAAAAGAGAEGPDKKLSPEERIAAAKKQAAVNREQRAANKWDREGRGKYDDKGYMQRRMLGTRDRVLDSINQGAGSVVSKIAGRAENFEAALHEVRANPVRKGLAAAGKAAKYGSIAVAAGSAASAGVPVVAAYGAYKAIQARTNRAESTLQKPSANERRLDEYRSHINKQEAIAHGEVQPEIVGRVDASSSRWDATSEIPDAVRAKQAESYDADQAQRGRTTSGFDRGGS